jgi:hypothetical protein
MTPPDSSGRPNNVNFNTKEEAGEGMAPIAMRIVRLLLVGNPLSRNLWKSRLRF